MKAPCHECTERSSVCHANCKQYQTYSQYREAIRAARHKEQTIRSLLIDGAAKIKTENYRHRKR